MSDAESARGSRGVLFDVGGTLVDTTYLHAVCWWEAFRQVGMDVSMASIHRAIGMGSDTMFEHLLGEDRDTERDAGISAAHKSLYSTYWDRLRPLPGAADLLRHCGEVEDTAAAATSAADARVSKPAPDILEAALQQSGLDAGQVVFVGTPSGMCKPPRDSTSRASAWPAAGRAPPNSPTPARSKPTTTRRPCWPRCPAAPSAASPAPRTEDRSRLCAAARRHTVG